MEQKKHIEERIELYLADRLTLDEIEDLWLDIMKQPEYLDHLKINIALKELYKNEGNKKASSYNYYKPWLFAAAAALLLAFILSFFLSFSSPAILTLNKIDLVEIESPSMVRSGSEQFSQGDSLLNLAFNSTVIGDTDKALILYNKIIEDPQYNFYYAKAHLNQGIIYFNQERFTEAAQAFKTAIIWSNSDQNIVEKSYWYLGKTYVGLKALPEARESIFRTYQMNGHYRSEAEQMLISLDSILD
ncbi:MAG: tetratricopeptide repeat protein [Balneolales bacterium]